MYNYYNALIFYFYAMHGIHAVNTRKLLKTEGTETHTAYMRGQYKVKLYYRTGIRLYLRKV